MLCVKLTKEESSLVSGVSYDEELMEMEVSFHKYVVESYTYFNVSKDQFVEFITADSIGRYYLNIIKNNYSFKNTQDMADEKNKPKGINKASDQTRYIKMRLDVTKLKKEFFFKSEKTGAIYADVTLHMKPDGEVDNYENLGFVTQDVPYEMKKTDKTLKGEILGNGKEISWDKEDEKLEGYKPADGIADDLPF